MKYDRIIWDFNGTILDDLRISIDSADELLVNHGLKPINTIERYYEVFGFPIIEYYKRIGFDFDLIPYSILAHEWVEIYLRRVTDAPIRDGIIKVIDKLNDLGIKQSILSMTKQEMLEKQIQMLGITNKFDEIFGLSDIYANSKLELAKNWRNDHPYENVLFVGDTTHDAESASVIGCKCILLAGGHQSVGALKESNVDIILSPDEILKEINKR